ncbi:septal ring lytic transglycosylase RlpA family protein [Bacteroides propionicifaciens]|uniref:septal ring lytic transglycosylase RlpA family protein n=1 Tax=Bacteroides propionicifaciens TaxID=392838 RepID=UPI00036ACF35|nr:septal ring lytic transglycosylase RlpA family protein [Bacteroides propionicifaciens]
MRKQFLVLIISILSTTYVFGQKEIGSASYYSNRLHGRKTASGELYNKELKTCAHPIHPFGTKLNIINPENGRRVVVRVNDRGPFHSNRIVDISYVAAKEIGLVGKGVSKVVIEVIKDFSDKIPPTLPNIYIDWSYIQRLTFCIPDKLLR